MVRRRSVEKERFWGEKIAEHQHSGLSVKEFCRRKAISQPSFYAWRRKLELRERGQDADVQLIPVVISESADHNPTRPSITIRLPGGIELDVFASEPVR